VEVRIGVTQTPKEIEVELSDGDRDRIVKDIETALAGEGSMLWLTDRRGRVVGVPAAKLAYVEINPTEERKVGFSVS
jgi:hypothetical protein